MKILFLSQHRRLIDFLVANGDEVTQTVDPLTAELLDGVDFIISYGYRHRISKEVTDRFAGRAINLHISYLPWNRGADPNLWSFLEDTPKGTSIHLLDGRIDAGDLLAQKRLYFDENDESETLKTTYRKLIEATDILLKEKWLYIRDDMITPMPQLAQRSDLIPHVTYHRIKDKERYLYLLSQGYDTPIKNIIGRARER